MSFSQKICDPIRARFASFFRPAQFGAKQILQVSFVLAVLSLSVLAALLALIVLATMYLPLFGLFQMSLFVTMALLVLLLASQGLILFGFPLYYAQDQRSHMTGFRIMLGTFMWVMVLLVFVTGVDYKLTQMSLDSMPVQDLEGVLQSLPE